MNFNQSNNLKGNIVLKPIEVKNGISMYMLDEKFHQVYYINIMNGAPQQNCEAQCSLK